MRNLIFIALCFIYLACDRSPKIESDQIAKSNPKGIDTNFAELGETTEEYKEEKFADLRVIQYKVPGFERLDLKKKELIYYLYEASLAGRDILWDQNCKFNLTIRKTLEVIVSTYNGLKYQNPDWQKFLVYAKRVWFSNGIHHHYTLDKFTPDFNSNYLNQLILNSDTTMLPLEKGETLKKFSERISKIIFDRNVAQTKTNLNSNVDFVTASAVNYYEGVSKDEAVAYYTNQASEKTQEPVSYGLNSKLVKVGDKIIEKKWMVGGMYTESIERIVYWLRKAVTVSENSSQKKYLEKLIEFYTTGSLRAYDEYCILWVKDNESTVEFISGFVEVYNDPLGYKGAYESIVGINDLDTKERIDALASEINWFEENSPIDENLKSKSFKKLSIKIINVAIEAGDAAPTTAIGITLPNSEWINKVHGGKSYSLDNIIESYDHSSNNHIVDEFYPDDTIKELIKTYGALSDKMSTNLHEVIGHASGKILSNKSSAETLKEFASTIEEAHADLVSLYYILDPKLIDMGLFKSLKYGKDQYNTYLTKGLMIQLSRIKLGKDLEDAHMRNRQLICKWLMEKGKPLGILDYKKINEKTFIVINDYNKLRQLIGQLLNEIQKIISYGNYDQAKQLVQKYGIKVDRDLHAEVLKRYSKLSVSAYNGFIQPYMVPVYNGTQIVDVTIKYPANFIDQMLYYGKKYNLLPLNN